MRTGWQILPNLPLYSAGLSKPVTISSGQTQFFICTIRYCWGYIYTHYYKSYFIYLIHPIQEPYIFYIHPPCFSSILRLFDFSIPASSARIGLIFLKTGLLTSAFWALYFNQAPLVSCSWFLSYYFLKINRTGQFLAPFWQQ